MHGKIHGDSTVASSSEDKAQRHDQDNIALEKKINNVLDHLFILTVIRTLAKKSGWFSVGSCGSNSLVSELSTGLSVPGPKAGSVSKRRPHRGRSLG